jgi:hypothetical protein
MFHKWNMEQLVIYWKLIQVDLNFGSLVNIYKAF